MVKPEIYSMMGKYYFVIRNKNHVMIHSSPLYKTKLITIKKAKEWKRKHKLNISK